MYFPLKCCDLFKHMRCLYHHGDTNPAQLYFIRFITENWWSYSKLKMKEHAVLCVLLLNNDIRIFAEHFDTF